MSQPGIELEPLTAWLAARLPGLAPPLELTQVGRGRSNLTYAVRDAAGARMVLRRPPLGELLPSAHDMRREHRVLAALADTDVPVPRSLAFCEDPAVTGAPFYAMELLDGAVLDARDPAERLAPAARAAVAGSLARTLARLHALDADALGLGDLGRGAGYAERQLRRWSRQWAESRTRELPVVERVATALAAGVPPARETRIVHGDYNLANVVVSRDGAVVGVLDWELCTLGDPVADLGTLLVYWPDDERQALRDRDAIPLLSAFGSRRELIDAYAAAAPGRDLSALPFWLALAYWKLAIILEGVHARWLEQPANGGPAAPLAKEAADHAAALAEGVLTGEVPVVGERTGATQPA